MTALLLSSDESAPSEDSVTPYHVLNSYPESISDTKVCPHLFKSSSSPTLPALLLPHYSTESVLSLARGESSEQAKAEALSRALAEDVAPLTSAEQELVRETWARLEGNLADNGIALYLRLFEIAPMAKGLFAFGEDEDDPLEKDPTMRLHASEVLKSLGLAACRVGQSSRVGGVLENLGRRHVDYGATLETYDVVKEAFLYVVEHALGEDSSAEVLTAWSKAYDYLAHAMKRGHQAVVAERSRAAAKSSPSHRWIVRKPMLTLKVGLNKLRSFQDPNKHYKKGRSWHGATNYVPAMGADTV